MKPDDKTGNLISFPMCVTDYRYFIGILFPQFTGAPSELSTGVDVGWQAQQIFVLTIWELLSGKCDGVVSSGERMRVRSDSGDPGYWHLKMVTRSRRNTGASEDAGQLRRDTNTITTYLVHYLEKYYSGIQTYKLLVVCVYWEVEMQRFRLQDKHTIYSHKTKIYIDLESSSSNSSRIT